MIPVYHLLHLDVSDGRNVARAFHAVENELECQFFVASDHKIQFVFYTPTEILSKSPIPASLRGDLVAEIYYTINGTQFRHPFKHLGKTWLDDLGRKIVGTAPLFRFQTVAAKIPGNPGKVLQFIL